MTENQTPEGPALAVNLTLTDTDSNVVMTRAVAFGLAHPVILIELDEDGTADPEQMITFNLTAHPFSAPAELLIILDAIVDALRTGEAVEVSAGWSEEDHLTYALQATGPDEFPEEYYRNIARERLAAEAAAPTVTDAP